VELVEEPLVLDLVGFVENHCTRRAVVLPEALGQLVMGR
jgi:hypothetical protein